MKRFLKLAAALITATVMVSAASAVVSAGSYDDAFSSLKLSQFAEYKSGSLKASQLRAFGVDPNGKYYYGGLLQGGSPTVYQFSASDGKAGATYTFAEDPGAYIKAIGADDRGYVYMGIANKANNGAIYFSICKENGLEEIKWVKIDIPGKIGVNGACAVKLDGKYYLYIVTNYDTDRLYRYNVTDVNNPTLDASFGTSSGYTDLSTFKVTDPNNICVGSDGAIYIAANLGGGSKGDTVLKLDKAGKTQLASAAVKEAFGVCIVGEYVASCTYNKNSSQVVILNQSDLSEVKAVTFDTAQNFTQLGLIGNKLYIADQGPDAVVVSTPISIPAPKADAGASVSAPATADGVSAAILAASLAAGLVVLVRKKH